MSPGGVPTPDVREHLFAAAERVLARESSASLTNRAITEEADYAKGLLYNHFADLDDFVPQLVLDRFARIAAEVGSLPSLAGQGLVHENVAGAALTLLGTNGPAVAAAAISRSGVADRVSEAWASGAPGPASAEGAVAEYLEREVLGRVLASADCPMLALAVAGTVHHLLMHGAGTGGRRELIGRLVRAVAPFRAVTP
jgi:AcrR family transcriptional regulator